MFEATRTEDGIYKLKASVVREDVAAMAHTSPRQSTLDLWHTRFGHINTGAVVETAAMVNGLDLTKPVIGPSICRLRRREAASASSITRTKLVA
jgi:hypothetical protein